MGSRAQTVDARVNFIFNLLDNMVMNKPNCNEHGTIYVISSDFGDCMATQSMGLIVLLSEHF